jgi:hypothetical protein
MYNGKLINKDLIIKDIIKDDKKAKNSIYIFVYDINEKMNICNYIV